MNEPASVQLYYFSGTGNARFVAQCVASEAQNAKLICQLTDLGAADRRKVETKPETWIGFISPTHGFNYPPVMLYFIFLFPRGHNPVFLMNTRAGMKMGRFFLPGLSGIALLLPALVLWLKGYRIRGMRSIDLPSNWISLHPGIRPKVVESIRQRCEQKTRKFAKSVFSGKRNYRALRDLPQDLLIAPISLGYFFIGRFMLAKSFVANSSCNNCGICISGCPVKAIKEVAGRPYWTFSCESCMKCMNHCPVRAIEAAHGLFVGLLFLGNLAQSFFLWEISRQWITIPTAGWWGSSLLFVINALLSLLSFYLGYLLIHYLSALKPVAWLVRYSSFTTWKWWRRYRLKIPRAEQTQDSFLP